MSKYFCVRNFMKLFKSLLVAPATLGLLAPVAATANEVTINDFAPAEQLAITNSRVDGLEARLNNFEAGGFSETTTASFSVDATIGAIDGDTTTEATVFEYQYNIGLSTSFTGEDSLDIAIDSGSDSDTVTDTDAEPEGNIGNGQIVHDNRCIGCHENNPAMAQRVPVLSDAELTDVIQNGQGYMPPQGLSELQVIDVIAFLRQEYP